MGLAMFRFSFNASRTKRLERALLLLVVAIGSTFTPCRAGFLGSSVEITWERPTRGSVWQGQDVVTQVGAGIEYQYRTAAPGGFAGFDFDIDAIFDACETHGVALELNAAPERLDLNDNMLRIALARPGIRFVINTDAHSVAELSQMHHGVRMARRAGVPASRVLNCLDAEAFARHLATRRPQ